MNFYKHYIGDFQRDTGHLSLTERGAYLTLMHHYYATEKPLPNDHSALCRVAGAITKQEQAAVRVAMGFFVKVDSGLMHSRIEAEIEKAGQQADTNRRIAFEREEKRRVEREQNEASTNRATTREPNQTPDTNSTDTNVSVVGVNTPPDCPHRQIIDLYNRILPELQAVVPSRWGGTRAKHLQARWKESPKHQTLAFWEGFFTELRNHAWYMGKNDSGWQATLGWLVERGNFDKMIDRFTDAARKAA